MAGFDGFFLFHSLCEVLRLPIMIATPCPLHPISEYGPPSGGFPTSRFGFANKLAWRLLWPAFWRLTSRDGINALRVASGAPRLTACPLAPFLSSPPTRPALVLCSAALLRPQREWPRNAIVIGAPVLRRGAQQPGASAGGASSAPTQSLPPALAAFLSTGPPPVAITLGSMARFLDDEARSRARCAPLSDHPTSTCTSLAQTSPHPQAALDPSRRSAATVLGLAAAAASPHRVVILTGGCGTGGTHANRGLSTLEALRLVVTAMRPGKAIVDDAPDIDHGALFPRCAAVVCHGGAGTVHAALRAASPVVVLACMPLWDQARRGDVFCVCLGFGVLIFCSVVARRCSGASARPTSARAPCFWRRR